MAEIVSFASGKGGVGKTLLTAALGIFLSRKGKKVLLIDGDMGMRNMDLVLGLESECFYHVMDLAEGDGFDSSRRDGAGWIASVMEDVTGDGNRTPNQIGRDFGSALESASRMTTQSGTFLATDTVKHVAAGSVEERLGFSSAIGTSVATEETFGRTLGQHRYITRPKPTALRPETSPPGRMWICTALRSVRMLSFRMTRG